ncbi:MAG: anthrone oxygenase family protein [Candidatus Acidiferrales bacterium]
MTIYLLTVLVLGLMCGSELNVGAFAHRALNRQPLETHVLMRATLARLFGRMMPFWMAGSALLNILLLLPFSHLAPEAWRLAALAAAIQVIAILFSLVAPVPINNRIMNWTPQTLPGDWKAQEQRWDAYHLVRTCGLIVAFAALIVSAMLQGA